METRDKVLNVRLTAEEYGHVTGAAGLAGVPLSVMACRKLLFSPSSESVTVKIVYSPEMEMIQSDIVGIRSVLLESLAKMTKLGSTQMLMQVFMQNLGAVQNMESAVVQYLHQLSAVPVVNSVAEG